MKWIINFSRRSDCWKSNCKSLNISNIIQTFCPDHKNPEIYCVCRSSEQNDDMVLCDCCSIAFFKSLAEWFHYHCVGVG